MKNRVLVSCIILSTLVTLLLTTAAQATEDTEKIADFYEKNGYTSYFDLSELQQTDEYREVKAEDVLKQIESGQDVNLTDCRIVGKLDLNKIVLKTVPNPRYREISQKYSEEVEAAGISVGYVDVNEFFESSHPEIRRELKVVESNITIHNCILEDDLDFSYAAFKKPISFSLVSCFSKATFTGSYFNKSAYFGEATFNDSDGCCFFRKVSFNNTADFSFSTFEDNVDFPFAIFNYTADFYGAIFNGTTDFTYATFNYTRFSDVTFNDTAKFTFTNIKHASFYDTTFKSTANFEVASFGDSDFSNVYFKGAYFKKTTFYDNLYFYNTSFKDAYFEDATFKDDVDLLVIFEEKADFYNAIFNDTAYFIGPKSAKNIITDGTNSQLFIKYYKNIGQYDDADVIYYNYRKDNQARREWSDSSKWTDIVSWITCGYGIIPFRTFYIGGFFVGLFSLLYWLGQGIYKSSEAEEKTLKVSCLDALLFSIREFTTLGSADWYPKHNFRIIVTLEGVLGYIMLGIFMAALTTVMIRY
jgi:uncharacterized protein YjbI with pentapeptide repeats